MDMLAEMLHLQRQLQVESFGSDPCALEGDARALFIRWNQQALVAETFEMLDEVGWKEWATSRHVNADEAFREMVDGWHFFMNILLAVYGPGVLRHGEEWLARELAEAYVAKRARNAERQEEGYDGVAGKCPGCHRDLREVSIALSDDGRAHCGSCGTRVAAP